MAEIVNGDAGSLADVDGIGDVATALDEERAHMVVLSAEPDDWMMDPAVLGRRLTPAQLEQLIEEVGETALAPWDVAAVGEAFAVGDGDETPPTGPGGEPLESIDMVVVLWHADEGRCRGQRRPLGDAPHRGNFIRDTPAVVGPLRRPGRSTGRPTCHRSLPGGPPRNGLLDLLPTGPAHPPLTPLLARPSASVVSDH